MNGSIYDYNKNLISTFQDGNGILKEYDNFGNLKFEGEYINGENMEKNIIFIITGFLIQILKANI